MSREPRGEVEREGPGGRALSVLQLGSTDGMGGAAAVARGLAAGLERRGHRVRFAVGFKRSGDPRVREIFDTPLNRLASALAGGRNVRARVHRLLAPWLANDIALLPGRRLLRWPEFREADLVHAHNLHSLWFNLKALPAVARAKPVIWTLHDMWAFTGYPIHAFDCPHWPEGGCDCRLPNSLPAQRWNNTRRLWRLKEKIYRRSPLTLVVPSRWLGERVGRGMLRDKPVHVIPNGVDTALFRPRAKAALRAELDLPQDRAIVLFSSKGGRANPWKGWPHAERLIAARRSDPRLYFLCLGGEPARDGDLRWLGYVRDPAALADCYAASDLFLYPSIADNCPLAVLEAMASGLPVLTFATGGIPELVEHRATGWVAAYRDDGDLAAGFEWWLGASPEERGRLAAAARRRAVERFDAERMVADYLALYRRLLGAGDDGDG